MPRGKLKRVDFRGQSLPGVELFAKYHIIGMRHTRNGYISQVKHVQFGWMTPQEYYRLEKTHDLMPLLMEVLRGGYRLKAHLWGAEISAEGLGIGLNIPIGLIFPLVPLMTIAYTQGLEDLTPEQKTQIAIQSLAVLLLPFGELYTFYGIAKQVLALGTAVPGVLEGIEEEIKKLRAPIITRF